VHDSRGIEIVNFTTAAALSAGTLMASAGTPYRLVPAHFYPWVTFTFLPFYTHRRASRRRQTSSLCTDPVSVQATGLTNRSSSSTVTIDLRRTSNLPNILRRTQGFSWVRFTRKIVRSTHGVRKLAVRYS